MTAIEELQSAVTTVAERVGPSIVGVGRGTRGSGVVIADGTVLTNAHNLRGDEVTVTFADGRANAARSPASTATATSRSSRFDTAGASPLEWGDGSTLGVGAAVFGAAASHGGGTRVTFGLVSAVARAFRGPGGRRIDGSIEHTAPMAPGSSGSALVDGAGRLVGLNTNRIGEGFYLALPADAALKARVDALARGETPSRERLGVAIAPSHVAPAAPPLGRSARARRRPRPWRRGRQPGRGGRHRGRATSSSRRAARRWPTATTCSRRSDR